MFNMFCNWVEKRKRIREERIREEEEARKKYEEKLKKERKKEGRKREKIEKMFKRVDACECSDCEDTKLTVKRLRIEISVLNSEIYLIRDECQYIDDALFWNDEFMTESSKDSYFRRKSSKKSSIEFDKDSLIRIKNLEIESILKKSHVNIYKNKRKRRERKLNTINTFLSLRLRN